jgi:cytochrome b subunit of formate dehydrogenase
MATSRAASEKSEGKTAVRRKLLYVLLAILPVGTACLFALSAVAQTNEDCLMCHGEQDAAPFVEASVVEGSVHGELSCTVCHWAASEIPHVDPEVHRQQVIEICGTCHGDVAELVNGSAHGQAISKGTLTAAVCTDCHGSHEVRPPSDPSSPANPVNVSSTCGNCHGAMPIATKPGLRVNPVSTHEKSYHGLAARFGSVAVANCASCHGHHEILPSTDPASPVSAGNLAKTCGRCHPGAGKQLAGARFHSTPSTSSNPIVRYVFVFYVLLIILGIGGMSLHNITDFARRLAAGFKTVGKRGKGMKESLPERVQYLGIVVSFIVLAYTGFALRFPEAWWTSPLRLFENAEEIRRILHRAAAVSFSAFAVYHLLLILLTRRGREKHRDRRPGFQDVKDLATLTSYNLGLSERAPEFRRLSYVEKSEYWAMVWGFVVMLLSGLFLAFNDFTLSRFPLWVSELARTVHFYEAVLAVLAGVVWHLYWTIFDPHDRPLRTPKRSKDR